MSGNLRKILIIAGVLFVVVVIALNVTALVKPGQAVPRELVYTVPQGTIAKYGLGAGSIVFPNEIELTVGTQDTLVIQNQDDTTIGIAGVLLGPGQTYRQQFTRPGIYDLACSVHVDERIRVVVNPPVN